MGSEALSAEAIGKIVELADSARETKFVRVPGEAENVFWRCQPGGGAIRETAVPPMFNGQFKRPDDVVAYIDTQTERSFMTFYNEFGIHAIDDQNSDYHAVCEMTITPQFEWLRDRSKGALDQKAFVRLLRIDFRGCLDAAPNLLGLVRNLKFTNAGQAVGNIQHGRESLGKSIESQVSGEDSIPEEIRVSVPVWKNWNVRESIMCAIEIESQTQQFRLTPYPNELDNALDRSLMALHAFLDGGKDSKRPPVFRGHPVIASRKSDE